MANKPVVKKTSSTNVATLTKTELANVKSVGTAATGIFTAGDVFKASVMEHALDLLKAGFLPAYLAKKGAVTDFGKACYQAVQMAAINSLPDNERKTVCLMKTADMDEAQKKLRETVLSGTVRPKVGVIAYAMALATPELKDSAKLIAKNVAAKERRAKKEADRRAKAKAELDEAKGTRAPQQPTAPAAPATATAPADRPYPKVAYDWVVKAINTVKTPGKNMTDPDKVLATELKAALDKYEAAIKAAK